MRQRTKKAVKKSRDAFSRKILVSWRLGCVSADITYSRLFTVCTKCQQKLAYGHLVVSLSQKAALKLSKYFENGSALLFAA